MLKVVQEHLEEYLKDKKRGYKLHIPIINYLDDMHMFIVKGDYTNEDMDKVDITRVGLPFQTCYFAVTGHECLEGMFIHEEEPNVFKVQIFIKTCASIIPTEKMLKLAADLEDIWYSEEQLYKMFDKFIDEGGYCGLIEFKLKLKDTKEKFDIETYNPDWLKKYGEQGEKMLDNIIEYTAGILITTMYYINNKQTTLTETDEQIKVRARLSGKFTKIKYKPNYIIHINSEKKVKQEYPNARIITKPNYSWEVRGFWRQLANRQKIGHDRNGLIIYNGYTWVKPHVRGEGELIKKVRVM